ncbi:MAG: ABC transporter permease, partial [Anaerolineae bacterium]
AQHKRQIGIMKAVGARAHQVVGMYVVVVACFGILSLFVALPTGALGSLLITNYAASRVNFDLISPPLPLRVVAVQAAVAVIVPTIAAMVPVFSGTAVTVREAISDYGLGGGAHPAWIDRLAERVRMLPRPFLLSLRNTFRRKARLALTLVTLTLAGAIFISVFSVQESLELTLEDALGYYGFDAQVTLGGAFRAERIEREALRVPGVLAVESWRTAGGYRIRPGGQEGDYLSLIGVPAETRMLNPIMDEGRWLLPADEAAIVVNTDFLKNEPDVGLGDEVMLEIGGRESRFTVVGVAQAIHTGPSAYINYPHLAEVLRGIGRVDRILVAAEGETAHERIALADLLEERLRRLGITGAAGSTTDADRQEIEYQFDILIVFMFIMAAILTIVGGLGLAGTIGINVLERTREIGVMRAVGASDGAIRFIVMMEAIIIGAIAWVVGVVVALPMSRWLSDTIGITFLDDPLSYTFSLGGVFVWLGLTALLACAASDVPARRASRRSVREVIAYE